MSYKAAELDVAVIGAGHAGIEAALAASRLGVKTGLFTLSLDGLANMPCNPSIGGTGKGHLVFEIDALGGEMGRAADKAMLQSRMLNTGKGPAVHSLRMQEDRKKYQAIMKETLESSQNLSLIQAEVTGIEVKDGKVVGVTTSFDAFYAAKCVVIATGTSLNGRIIVGECAYDSGPDNTLAAKKLTESLKKAGVPIVRFKTGTPPRIHADSIDYSVLEEQPGDDELTLFSKEADGEYNKKVCYIAYTNPETHRIIRENLHRSPLFSGEIKGVGPRYCPSIESKIVRFADKERHQIFVEPMGENTKEVYLQGLSSSLPEDVQKDLVHSIKGLENAVFMRTAYAIEYDCTDPLSLKSTLEFKKISGLFGAGQFNGSSGYEEAACQGLIAGINAALKVKGKEEFTLSRSESYIGTLIDDLVTKGTNEPYRIMTSRSEYRLLLRQDNAKSRLTEKGYRIGLVTKEKYDEFLAEEKAVEDEIYILGRVTIPCTQKLNDLLVSKGYDPIDGGIRAIELLKRPYVTIDDVLSFDLPHYSLADLWRKSDVTIEDVNAFRSDYEPLSPRLKKRVEAEVKYEGYIKKELAKVNRFSKLESKKLPEDIDYSLIKGLRLEAVQKLSELRPSSLGQASRISGVSPADISVLMIYIKTYRSGK